jgi:hypothetical protein
MYNDSAETKRLDILSTREENAGAHRTDTPDQLLDLSLRAAGIADTNRSRR